LQDIYEDILIFSRCTYKLPYSAL